MRCAPWNVANRRSCDEPRRRWLPGVDWPWERQRTVEEQQQQKQQTRRDSRHKRTTRGKLMRAAQTSEQATTTRAEMSAQSVAIVLARCCCARRRAALLCLRCASDPWLLGSLTSRCFREVRCVAVVPLHFDCGLCPSPGRLRRRRAAAAAGISEPSRRHRAEPRGWLLRDCRGPLIRCRCGECRRLSNSRDPRRRRDFDGTGGACSECSAETGQARQPGLEATAPWSEPATSRVDDARRRLQSPAGLRGEDGATREQRGSALERRGAGSAAAESRFASALRSPNPRARDPASDLQRQCKRTQATRDEWGARRARASRMRARRAW